MIGGMCHERVKCMKIRGFTLIELMIVIAVIAVIAAIAIPSYNSQIQKTRRADAVSALLTGSQALERCFTRNNSYETSAGCGNDAAIFPTSDFYTFSSARTATTYTLSATPTARQTGDACGTFTLTHLGVRGPDPDPARCWGS